MEIELKRISVIGLGKLGAPLATCVAWKGFPTIGVDTDPKRIQAVNQGMAPIYEPGLQELLTARRGRLTATEDYEKALNNSDETDIVVPTPSDNHDRFSLRYVLENAEQIGDALRKKTDYHLVVLTSTVMPGATDGELRPVLESRSGKKCGPDFGLCYSPEFIALGSVIRDFLNPDFILIGESDPRAGEMLAHLYERVCENNPPIARMNSVNAELTKLAVNTYVTTKITFANMLARICERLPGGDVDVVTRALGLDSRIGRKYLKGAIGYGGPCFPRDNMALASLARQLGVPATLAEATHKANKEDIDRLAILVKDRTPNGGAVGVLGIAYKPNTDVIEESAGLLLVQKLLSENIPVIVYDPAAMENAGRVLGQRVQFAGSVRECIDLADVVVLATPWELFHKLEPAAFAHHSPTKTVIDCWGILDSKGWDGVDYVRLGVGKPSERPMRW